MMSIVQGRPDAGRYAVHGAILRRYSRSVDKLAGDGTDAVARFRRGCGRLAVPCRPCGHMGRWRESSPHSCARAAVWPASTPSSAVDSGGPSGSPVNGVDVVVGYVSLLYR